MSIHHRTPRSDPESPGPITAALVLSLLAHLGLVAAIDVDVIKTIPRPIPVRLVALPDSKNLSPSKRQIVSPSDGPKSPAPVESNLLSDENTSTAVQQIRRGDPVSRPERLETGKALMPSKPLSVASAEIPRKPITSEAKNETEREYRLKLDTKTIDSKIARRSQPNRPPNVDAKMEESEPSSKERQRKLEEYSPFRPNFQDRLFTGPSGIPDFLPDVQDGEITLLNAKADRHAVFVRRVAYQVFSALRQKSWDLLPFGELHRMRGYTTVEATLSPQGKLLNVSIVEESGSISFDKTVAAAATQGVWDKNPPQGAVAPDGNIHFVFKSRTWARRAGDHGPEQRWLLLATGLL